MSGYDADLVAGGETILEDAQTSVSKAGDRDGAS